MKFNLKHTHQASLGNRPPIFLHLLSATSNCQVNWGDIWWTTPGEIRGELGKTEITQPEVQPENQPIEYTNIWGFPKMVGFPNNHGFSY